MVCGASDGGGEAVAAWAFTCAGVGAVAVVHGCGCEQGWSAAGCGMLAQDHFKMAELRAWGIVCEGYSWEAK